MWIVDNSSSWVNPNDDESRSPEKRESFLGGMSRRKNTEALAQRH